MAKIVLLFAFVAFVHVAKALDCYSCDAVTCQQEQSKWQKIPNCGNTVSTQNTGACLKQIQADKTGKDVTTRKCVIAEKGADGKAKFTCNQSEGKVSVCEVCTTDLCNSAAPVVSFSFITFLGVVAAFLIPKYL